MQNGKEDLIVSERNTLVKGNIAGEISVQGGLKGVGPGSKQGKN